MIAMTPSRGFGWHKVRIVASTPAGIPAEVIRVEVIPAEADILEVTREDRAVIRVAIPAAVIRAAEGDPVAKEMAARTSLRTRKCSR